ncbi:MAG: helix-turn-helix transcriptional regulator [Lachnospiraceae bacterium]|nr:helix-turn-helix transcriptional regulator [Lachnospiraceae bacterium]
MYKKYLALLGKTNKTTYQVSKETGVSQTAFSNWKSGRSEPSLESLRKLAKYFNVPIEYFLNEEGGEAGCQS